MLIGLKKARGIQSKTMLNKIQRGDPQQGTATHATLAKVTFTAVAKQQHYLTDIAVSSDKAGAIVLVKDGTTVIWQLQIGASFYGHRFSIPLKASVGALLSVEIDGTAACKANAVGVTLKNQS